jgi:hypothetical protein
MQGGTIARTLMQPQKTIPLPADLFDRIEEEAQLEGKSIEEFLEAAVQRYLATSRLQRLQRYGAQRARELGLTEDDIPRLISEYRNERRR